MTEGMRLEQSLAELQNLTTIEAKSAYVAKSIIDGLPSKDAEIALLCGTLPWFDAALVAFVGKEMNASEELFSLLMGFPFVEPYLSGHSFHKTTRDGLFQSILTEDTESLIRIYEIAHVYYLKNWANPHAACAAMFSLILLGNSSVVQLHFDEFIESIDKAEFARFCRWLTAFLANDILDIFTLSSKQWQLITMGMLLSEDLANASICSEHAIETGKTDPSAFVNRGLILTLQGKIKKATASYTHAVSLSKSVDTFIARANHYIIINQPKKAISDCSRAIRVDPNSSTAYAVRGQSFLMKDDPHRAIRDFNNALKIDPGNIMALIARANAHVEQEAYESALRDFDELAELDVPSNLILSMRAKAYIKAGDIANALEDFNAAIELDPMAFAAYKGRGDLHFEMKNYELALEDYVELARLSPNFPQIYSAIWETYIKLGRDSDAYTSFEDALNQPVTDPEYFISLQHSALRIHQYELAFRAIQKAMNLDPENHDALYGLGWHYLRNDQLDQAASNFKLAISTSKNDFDAVYSLLNLGIVLLKQGFTRSARGKFKSALKRIPKGMKELLNLEGLLDILVGMKERGLLKLRKFVESDPEFNDLEDLHGGLVHIKSSRVAPDGIDEAFAIIDDKYQKHLANMEENRED